MSQPIEAPKAYQHLSPRAGSAYRELFILGRSIRAQSLVAEMENDGLTPQGIAERYGLELDAVLEAIDYFHANEAFLSAERRRIRDQAIAEGYLNPDSE
ncbi:MAG: hypothetical protein HY000_33230 [Planctomycetes bacterium]|nr:hypothetical protein [Planctomycetota bacterium]